MRLSITRSFTILAALTGVLAGCGAGEEGSTGELWIEESVASQAAALDGTLTLEQATNMTCSTFVMDGLTRQLIAELNCMSPGTLVSIADIPNVTYGSAAYQYMQAPAARALRKAMQGTSRTIGINSALRTLPQQLMIHRWYQARRCGITQAADPAQGSNHQSGIAFDTDARDSVRTLMAAKGYRWLGSGDPVHYDYTGPGTQDIRALSVRSFQRLWNRNNPRDRIAEDGEYGPATERRLLQSPIGGFRQGPTCGI